MPPTRKEQREQARAERQAREAAAREAERRRRRLWQIGAAAGAVIAIAVVAVAIASSGSGGSGPQSQPSGKTAPVPAAQVTDLGKAAAAAGCQLNTYQYNPTSDRTHVADGTVVHYKTNPPTYGAHYPIPAPDGDYVGQTTPPTGKVVHALEHGRIEIQYRPGVPKHEIGQLETVFNESAGPYSPGLFELLFQNATGMPYDVAAAAWAHSLTCPHFNPRVFDALRDFRAAFSLKGPEYIPQPE